MKHLGTLLALHVLMACSNFGNAAEQAALLAPLDDQLLVQGCRWSASARSVGTGYMFMAEYDDSAAWMNIAGSDVRLEVDPALGKLERVGDILRRHYSAPGIDVLAQYTASWVCPAGSEGACEVTRFGVSFEVTTQDRIQIVDGSGELGC